jgi:hypothetical protein
MAAVGCAGPALARIPSVPRSFCSFEEFLAADPRRDGGDHLALGGWWRSVEAGVFSAAWAPGTGELYLRSRETGRVRVIGAPMDRAEVVRRLDGWRAVVGRRASIEWLLAQAAARTKRDDGIASKGCTWPRTSLKRTLARPLGQQALSPAA